MLKHPKAFLLSTDWVLIFVQVIKEYADLFHPDGPSSTDGTINRNLAYLTHPGASIREDITAYNEKKERMCKPDIVGRT